MDPSLADAAFNTGPQSLSTLHVASFSILIVLLTVVAARWIQSALNGDAPPLIEPGLPLVGGLVKLATEGPYALMEECFSKCGEAFTVPLLHKRMTFLIGPDVITHFMKATDDEMSQKEVYGYSVSLFGKNVVYDVDVKVRNEQYRFFTDALKSDRLKQYVPLFKMEIEDYFSKWGDEGVVDLFEEFTKLVTLTAARTLLGREIRENMFEEVSELLHDLDEGLLPITVLLPNLPIPAHLKRDRARERLAGLFEKVVNSRRASGKKEVDVLQQFIDARYSSKILGGRELTPQEICGLLIASLFAGQHTSSITSSWTGYYMINDQDKSYKKAVEEQKALLKKHGDIIDFDTLGESEVLHRNIMEALRMHPPLILVLRYARSPFSVTTSTGKQYTVPKGDICCASPNFQHMMPGLFTHPKTYDPERYAPGREEDKRKQFSFIGFGGGRHGCLGQNFAYLQIKTIWTVLLRNFDFELLDPVPPPNYKTIVVGPLPCRVRYVRRKLAADV